MPMFNVEFATSDGRTGVETIDAPNERGAVALIETSGRTPIEIVPATGKMPSRAMETSGKGTAARPRAGRLKRGKSARRAVVAVTQQLTSVVESGIPVLSGLRVIADQTEDGKLKSALSRIAARIEGGDSLTEALEQEPEYFSPVYVKTVAAGEASGHLAEVLDTLGRFEEQDLENRGNVRSALLYPALVVGALVVATIVMLWFVIPQFASMFAKFGADLPPVTKLLLGTSTFLKNYALWLLAAAVATPFAWRRIFAFETPRRHLDRLKLHLPVFGPLLRSSYMDRMVELLNLMNRSSLPIIQSLHLTADAMTNVEIRDDVRRLARDVEGGESLGEAFSHARWITPLVKRMLTVGEQSGRTDRIFEYLGRYYRVQTQRSIKTLSTLIEPVLISGLAAIVLTFSLAIFMPMWRMLKLVGTQ